MCFSGVLLGKNRNTAGSSFVDKMTVYIFIHKQFTWLLNFVNSEFQVVITCMRTGGNCV